MNSEVVGQQLRQEREAQGLSLEQVSKATYIRLHYLQVLESGNLESIPSQTQARGFLRTYASYLKLDPEQTMAILEGTESLPLDEAPTMVEELPPPAETPPITPTPKPASLSQAEKIFREIGASLKRQREILGLSLEDVERHTRLRQRYLLALEAGDMEALPSPVQGRGMLNNYAVFLGMDPEPVLLRFADALQVRLALRQNRPSPSTERGSRQASSNDGSSRDSVTYKRPSQLRRFLSFDMLFGSTLAIFLIVFSVWGALRIINLRSGEPANPTAPSIAEVLLATTTLETTATPTPLSITQEAVVSSDDIQTTELPPLPTLSGESAQVYLTIHQRAFLRVTVDDEEVFSGRVMPDTAYTYTGENKVELLTSNGAAIQVFYNGEDQGRLGFFGQIVYRVYTPQGIITPTPTITLTPLPTETPTATPQPTSTISSNLPTPPTRPALP